MQTVQLTCGKCGKVMAISTEHLGTQVHCPHCMEIVQAPPRAPEPEEIKGPSAGEGESIFGASSDEDIFGTSPKALVEMPEPPPPPRPPPPVQPPADDDQFPSARLKPEPDPHERDGLAGSATSGDSQLPTPPVQTRHRSNSMLVPMLLIFLVPYAIICTVYIAWNLINPPRPNFDPFELMPDSNFKDGGTRRIDPAAPLPKKLKTSLKNPLQIGDLEVAPLKVRLHNDDLELHLKLVNTSKDLLFNPIPLAFVTYVENKKNSLRPYTFLDTGKTKLFGGYLEWWKVTKGKKAKKPAEGGFSIGPGEEMLAVLTTYDKDREKVKGALQAESFLWRIHVRRGFVPVRKKSVSATAVVGVEFTAKDIEMDNEQGRAIFGEPGELATGVRPIRRSAPVAYAPGSP